MQDCAVPCSCLLSPLAAKSLVVAVALVSFVIFVPFVAKAVAVELRSVRSRVLPTTEVKNSRRVDLNAIAPGGV